jgi:pimeloyl-ACP methyl ester carboxylesterase
VVGCSNGTLDGALTRVCFPADWNGGMVLYAHGYVEPGAPLAIPQNLVGAIPLEDVINGLGYAYAATSYKANGLVADIAVEDIVALEEEVRRTVRPDPTRVYLVGVSEGGLVAALAAENEADRYTGVLAACGPIGSFVRQIDYFNDVRIVFDYLFPGVIPGSAIEPPESVRSAWETVYAPAVLAALAADPGKAAELVAVTGIPAAGADATVLNESIAGILWYNVLGTADAQQRLGGQPYDNAGRVYAGSADDAALNAGVARYEAEAVARAALDRFETSGLPLVPISIIHTTGDPIVPFFHQPLYADKVATAGAAELLDQAQVERFGHCTFTPNELLDAFGALPQ